MINQDKWINSLPKINTEFSKTINQLDHEKWINTISKKPLEPNMQEIGKNIRSRSAKLRYAIRNNNSFFYPNEFKNKFVNYFELEGGGI